MSVFANSILSRCSPRFVSMSRTQLDYIHLLNKTSTWCSSGHSGGLQEMSYARRLSAILTLWLFYPNHSHICVCLMSSNNDASEL